MLDLKRLKRLIRIDTKSLTVTAEAGINGEILERELNQLGLTLGHYPASGYCATLAGIWLRGVPEPFPRNMGKRKREW